MTAEHLRTAARDLSRELAKLAPELELDAQGKPLFVLDPTCYAWGALSLYLSLFDGRRRVMFVGMNPGPDGMVQTGLPFGDTLSATRLLELAARRTRQKVDLGKLIEQPAKPHPRKAIHGLKHKTREPSGSRFWDGLSDLWGDLETLVRDVFVVNYCPLGFIGSDDRNLVPEKLSPFALSELTDKCDLNLGRLIDIVRPQHIVGVGNFAEGRAREVVKLIGRAREVKVSKVLHPSPSNPAANRGWILQAATQLREAGVWPAEV